MAIRGPGQDPLDSAARALAADMPRRRALKIGGAAFAGLLFGGLRARPAGASHCIGDGKHCSHPTGDAGFCCPPDTICCPGTARNGCCGHGAQCVGNGLCEYPEDPCGPERYLCGGKCCPDKNNCCGGSTCCIEGQVCVNKRCRWNCPKGRKKCGRRPKCCPRGKRCRKGKCR